MKVAICGAGAWGTAMAVHLARVGHEVVLIPRTEEKAVVLQKERKNPFCLPGIEFPSALLVDARIEKISDCESVFLACPAKGLRSLCGLLKLQNLAKVRWIVSLVKGLEREGFKRPSQIVQELLPNANFVCLSGPTYALEFAQGKPAAMVLAAEHLAIKGLQEAISNDIVRVYRSKDLVGVELSGCLKNIYAIGAGMIDGLKLGDNAKAAYLTRALKEMCRLGCAWGGKAKTFYGLGGLGDFIATAQGQWSRNRTFGEKFAQGMSIEKLVEQSTVEGYWSLKGFFRLAQNEGIEAPLLDGLYAAIYKNEPILEAIRHLMLRKLKDE